MVICYWIATFQVVVNVNQVHDFAVSGDSYEAGAIVVFDVVHQDVNWCVPVIKVAYLHSFLTNSEKPIDKFVSTLNY